MRDGVALGVPTRLLALYTVRPIPVSSDSLSDHFPCSVMSDLPDWAQGYHRFSHHFPEGHRRLLALHFVAKPGSSLPPDFQEFLVLSVYAPVNQSPEQLPFWLWLLERLRAWRCPWQNPAISWLTDS